MKNKIDRDLQMAQDIIDELFAASRVLTSRYGGGRDFLNAYAFAFATMIHHMDQLPGVDFNQMVQDCLTSRPVLTSYVPRADA